MKIRNYFIACAVLLAGLASCNKSDEPGGDEGNKSPRDLYIKFEKFGSKADTNAATEDAVSFSEGALYFTDNAGRILRYIRITNEQVAGTLTATQLENGTTIEQVHGDATQVHLYGNFTAAANYVNLSDIPEINYDTQKSGDYGVSKGSLYGTAPIEEPTTAGDAYTADIQLKPIIARLEVDQLKGVGDIKSYKLAGIYINNFYLEVLPDGKVKSNNSAINYSQNFEFYYRESIQGTYPDGQSRQKPAAGKYEMNDYGYLFDDGIDDNGNMIFIGSSSTSGIIKPTGTWAYNIFATANATPHIVFHFLDVTINDGTQNGILFENTKTGVDGEAYLTITGYTALSNDLSGFVNIEGGNIYKMESVEFNENDLGEVPEVNEKKDVIVTVELMPWKIIKVNPSFE
ncbi:MAG: hypothetical protein LUH10_07060 [Tannerellaceae bacterium]|nr:hypothetical protein [Tannerellaceae bacterium]